MDNKKNKKENSNSDNLSLFDLMERKKNLALWLYSELTERLDAKDGFEIEHHVKWGPTSDSMTFDVVVRDHKFLTTVFEVQETYQSAKLAGVLMPFYVFKHTQAVFCIIYCKENHTFYLFTRKKVELEDETLVYSYDNEIITDRFEKTIITDIDKVIKYIKDEIITLKKEYYSSTNIKTRDQQFDLRFYEEKVLDPKWSREQLIEFNENEICRYSSLDSLFSTLKYGTFRMNGLPGMNDKDEGLFAWNMINDTKKLSNDEVKKRKGLINNAFIISYSYKSKIDDLIQWRLYGDDAKGVCCVYSVLQNKIDDRFFLHPIKYIEPPLKGKYPSDPLLAKLKKYVENQSDLDYSDLSPVIFYYKHKDYEPEAEVRLLVDNKKTSAYNAIEFKREWLLTYSNSIPNPYIDIPIKDFPLKLERIILGPNINDLDTIQVQLETMLSQLGIKAEVVPSKITSYRNPTK